MLITVLSVALVISVMINISWMASTSGCDHKWGKYSQVQTIHCVDDDGDTYTRQYQYRYCETCGKYDERTV